MHTCISLIKIRLYLVCLLDQTTTVFSLCTGSNHNSLQSVYWVKPQQSSVCVLDQTTTVFSLCTGSNHNSLQSVLDQALAVFSSYNTVLTCAVFLLDPMKTLFSVFAWSNCSSVCFSLSTCKEARRSVRFSLLTVDNEGYVQQTQLNSQFQ